MKYFFLSISVLIFFAGCSAIRLSSPLVQSESDWSMTGKNPAHTHYTKSDSLKFPMSVAWKYDASAGFGASALTVVDGVLFAGTLQGEYHAVDAITGKRIGHKKFSSPIGGAAVTDHNRAYLGLEGGRESFLAIDLMENRIEWSAMVGGIDCSPLLFGGKLYVGSTTGSLYCLSPARGEEVWKYETKGAIHSSPAAIDSLIIFGNDNGTVYAVHAANGSLLWQFQTNAALFGSAMISGDVVFIGSRDHYLYALDVRRGTLRWKYDVGDKIVACPSGNDSLVFIGALNGAFIALRQKEGTPVWTFRATSVINSSAVVTQSAIVVGSLNTELYALSPISGAVIWKYTLESRIKTSPILWKNLLFVAAEDRSVYCFRPGN